LIAARSPILSEAAGRVAGWWRAAETAPWNDPAPVRAELFGTERLEHHARTLAAAQTLQTAKMARVVPLNRRLKANAGVLLAAYRAVGAAQMTGAPITPAGDWLLDNYHVVEDQLRQISDDLPPGFYRQLPKLADGPFAGYPRVFGLAWAFVAHTDSQTSGPVLARFVQSYQQVQPLMIGEIWAVAISLRIVLIENMRRLATEITGAMALRADADRLADAILGSNLPHAVPVSAAMARWAAHPLPQVMAAQFVRRLRGCDPSDTPLLAWLIDHLGRRGLSLETVVQNAQDKQGATNVTMRNIVTSMKTLSEMDWADFFEEVSLIDASLRAASDFGAMDFATRNQYRTAIEELARGSRLSETEVAAQALTLADAAVAPHESDPGHWLIGGGRRTLERQAGFAPPLRVRLQRAMQAGGLVGYLSTVGAVTLTLSAAALWVISGTGVAPSLPLICLMLILATEPGFALVNLFLTRFLRPALLPGLDHAQGVPDAERTLVAVPVLLTGLADVDEVIGRLEVHHLSSTGGAVHYALLSDGPDAATEEEPRDAALIAAAAAGIARLNADYPTEGAARFWLLHRRRQWNPQEGRWMGWERKRGKLHELNRLLRGARDTSFLPGDGTGPAAPAGVRHVITLDADTRLLRDTVRLLVGKMAHPLNRPRSDPATGRVTGGYGILQPRVTPSLPDGLESSLFARLSSGPGGVEPYAAPSSDVYQDLFGRGSFTGKGIYHVDAFASALAGQVPDNTMLSHDLFEGDLARAGFASDISVVEDFPTRLDIDARRTHRWTRGDWQLMPWITGSRRHGVTTLGRWKMIDNLRRSLQAPLALAALLLAWLLPPAAAFAATAVVAVLQAVPRLASLPFAVLPGRAGITSHSHVSALGRDIVLALTRSGLALVLLPFTAWSMLDAILRTGVRMAVTRRHLLEWMTAAQTGRGGGDGLLAQVARMRGGLFLGAATCGLAVALNPPIWPLAGVAAVLWLAAPVIGWQISRPSRPHRPATLTPDQAQTLRLIARRTWRYFETFVTEADNDLPPDNFQEDPAPVVAHRTSPTNIGLYLLSITVARDFGWISEPDALNRLERTLGTLSRLRRHRGHLYNWYDTRSLKVLEPAYVSSVDSGNLAGHLIAVARVCRDWQANPVLPDRTPAITDALRLARQAMADEARADPGLAALIADLRAPGAGGQARLARIARQLSDLPGDPGTDGHFWIAAAHEACMPSAPLPGRDARLQAAADTAQRLALEMEFGFLLDPDKKLLSIGYSVTENRLDPGCYDLLASEARLASLFAIAKGDVETRHWFRLGRAATPVGAGSALISWSGSMFEYLMPTLVMRAPAGSVLEQTERLVVARQRAHAKGLGIPWGISESSYNARDLELTYQYMTFGVPSLGLKRGLAQNRVIAPYATGLAAMIDPQAALANFAVLDGLGAQGRFGFYEAVDFTAARLPAKAGFVIVRSFMAHHQGMTIAALANTLMDDRLCAMFRSDPMMQSVELLLQERVPRDASVARVRTEAAAPPIGDPAGGPVERRFPDPLGAAPTVHMLSNGRYSVMLTPTGTGFSQWRDLSVTRYRPGTEESASGMVIFLRDVAGGPAWSAAVQPVATAPQRHAARFCEHHAAFTHQGTGLATRTEIVVSPEDDAEARRVTLTNSGPVAREIDVTSYAELVLAPAAADLAHPAFSKMFVVTDHFPDLEVIVATRRHRNPDEPGIWAAHIAVVEGHETAPMQFETDRARFLGRGHSLASAQMASAPLSGTTGTVLDPVFSIRRRISVPPGGQARVTFWTMLAATPGDLLPVVERHRDPSAFDRAETLAWTHGQVQLHHLGISPSAALDFQRLAGFLIAGDTRLRPAAALIAAGAAPQSALWQHGISGDLPILLLRIDDVQDIAQVREVLVAQEYWRMRRVPVDLVILNEHASSYVQDLQSAIDSARRSVRAGPGADAAPPGAVTGSVHVLRADLMPAAARDQLLSVARVVLVAARGNLAVQLDRLKETGPAPSPRTAERPRTPVAPPPVEALPVLEPLEFFNGTGGFAKDGREYVTVLEAGRSTPAPWINVIANDGFGFHVSAEGSGTVWAENSRENLLTPRSNDPVTDAPGDAIYLRDLDTGALWTPTTLPMRGPGRYVARHGYGVSRFEHSAHGIDALLDMFVPPEDPVRITRIMLRNTSARRRRIAVTTYAEWVLGTSRSATGAHVVTAFDPGTGAIFAHNPFAIAFPGRTAFADLGTGITSHSADRLSVLGPLGRMSDPAGLRGAGLNGRSGAALDPCAALQRIVVLEPGAEVSLLALLGQTTSDDTARALIHKLRGADIDALRAWVTADWADLLGTVQVTSPDRSMDILLNGWLLYQTLAARVLARAGFYQASGAFGFRDQLQDGMALAFARPELTRAHILRAAARQFPEGDVQHWWLPHSGEGVRTHISDDRVWLAHAVAQYIATTGDAEVLDETLPFLQGPTLAEAQHDAFFRPEVSADSASLFEHCARGLDQAIALTGANGMPLIGTGDWNDGMSRVGAGGQGTSVWLGWFLIATLTAMAPWTDRRDPTRAARWRTHAEAVRQAIERDGWDGAWYRRGTYDDGTLLGTAAAEECRIDSIAQSWAVLSGAADPARSRQAMGSVMTGLVRCDPGLVLLFTPPFDRTPLDPGYIKGYPPGLRENGGQYSHAAMWAILAQARMGDGDAAHGLFALLNPINHALTPAKALRYKVEPYVIAADVYATAPHEGRGGWTWYTGAAGWMQRAGIEGLVGLTRRGPVLLLDPCLPRAWPRLDLTVQLGKDRLAITVLNPEGTGRGIRSARIDGREVVTGPGPLELPLRGSAQRVTVVLGSVTDPCAAA
jgi:cyclic beta-1,2-glucan synthetase